MANWKSSISLANLTIPIEDFFKMLKHNYKLACE